MDGSEVGSLASTFARWGPKGGIGILDQAVFSGANFALSIFLARSMSRDDFGAFALGFAVISFFMQVYTSFALEPMGVLGPAKYAGRIGAFLVGQARLFFVLMIPVGLTLGLIVWFNLIGGIPDEARSVLSLSGFAMPLILFPLLMRRIFLVLLKPGVAFLGSSIYSALLLFLAFTAARLRVLTDISAILILALAGLLCGTALLLILLRQENPSPGSIELQELLGTTWSFGKWLVLSGVLIGLATQSQAYMTGTLFGLEEAGEVRILQTFIQPIMLSSTALSALAAPAISADFTAGATALVRRKILRFTIVLTAISIIYELVLISLGVPLDRIIFQERYSAILPHLPYWGLVPIILSLYWGGAMALQAAHKPQAMLIIATFWSLFSLLPGYFLIPSLGVWGATISIIAGFAAALVSTWVLYWLWVHRNFAPRENAL